MSITTKHFLIILLCHVALSITGIQAKAIRRHPIIMVKCGERPVSGANVQFIEYENLHYKDEHQDFRDVTDKHGHYHFKEVDALDSLRSSENEIRISIKDICKLDTVKHDCNLPYNHFEVPIKMIPFVENQQLLLDLTDWKFDTKCI
ncbi:hypothetical protein B9Z55_004055 [Caenorhabditis nigoni]|nr:hypothetical protein B9Z55_004055 [Caenorhabditis nigoni]